jgi:hypothetical protein
MIIIELPGVIYTIGTLIANTIKNEHYLFGPGNKSDSVLGLQGL